MPWSKLGMQRDLRSKENRLIQVWSISQEASLIQMLDWNVNNMDYHFSLFIFYIIFTSWIRLPATFYLWSWTTFCRKLFFSLVLKGTRTLISSWYLSAAFLNSSNHLSISSSSLKVRVKTSLSFETTLFTLFFSLSSWLLSSYIYLALVSCYFEKLLSILFWKWMRNFYSYIFLSSSCFYFNFAKSSLRDSTSFLKLPSFRRREANSSFKM